MKFDIKKESKISNDSFRIAAIKGTFDIDRSEISERFCGNIETPKHWKIGLIYGGSGTGKSTIAKELFNISQNYEYYEQSVVDDMPKSSSVEDITRMFVSVGFGSTPSWLKPYSVLSNGERMRVDLARALLDDEKLVVFDEFTSVVDRHIAKIGSMCVQKSIRQSDKQFIAISCHDDIIPWLKPDWTFCTDSMSMIDLKKKDQKSVSRYSDAIETHGDCLAAITI